MKTFFREYLGAFVRPAAVFRRNQASDRQLFLGFWAAMVPALGYTLFYVMASVAGGAPSSFRPWLSLPLEHYFSYAVFLSVPGYLLAILFSSALTYLLCRALRVDVTFDALVMVLGVAVGVATWSSMLHDLIDSFLAVIGIIDMRWYERQLNEPTFWRALLLGLYAVYFVWIGALLTLGIRAVTSLRGLPAVLCSLVTLVAFQAVLLLFIR